MHWRAFMIFAWGLGVGLLSAATEIELREPTKATAVPMKIERRDSFSPTNASQYEAKIGYFKLNSETPCPPRGGESQFWFSHHHQGHRF